MSDKRVKWSVRNPFIRKSRREKYPAKILAVSKTVPDTMEWTVGIPYDDAGERKDVPLLRVFP